jgi:hypothetical protein
MVFTFLQGVWAAGLITSSKHGIITLSKKIMAQVSLHLTILVEDKINVTAINRRQCDNVSYVT